MIVGLHRIGVTDEVASRGKIANCRNRSFVIEATLRARWPSRAAKIGDLPRSKANRHAGLNCFKLLLAAESNGRRKIRDLLIRHPYTLFFLEQFSDAVKICKFHGT
jgi:hypothetical protein